MSDTQGERPIGSTPADTVPAADAAVTGPVPPAQPGAPAQPATPAQPGAPAQTVASAQPAAPAASTQPAAPHAGYRAPAQPPYPAHPAAGQTQPYAGQAYAGQPYGGQAYAGQSPQGAQTGTGQPAQPYATAQQGRPAAPAHGAAFGAAPSLSQTQPTLPLGPIGSAAPVNAPAEKKKSGAGKVAGLIVAAALVGGAAGLGGTYAGFQLFSQTVASSAGGPSTVTVNNPDSVNATTAIAAKVVPSVVTISAVGTSADASGGTGSGVVLTEDGYVVTNTHVVTLDGATNDARLRVTTSDGKVYDATIVGTDPTYDLAVIKLEGAEGLTPIEFASSSDLNVGDQTVAVGAPLGLANTVTTGIVSALNRSIQIASSAVPDTTTEEDGDAPTDPGNGGPFQFDFGQGQSQQQSTGSISIAVIQTDAAINPGNSGGALVDGEGRLIGINVAIATAGSSSGQSGSIGVGFAIPSDVVERITDEIIETGEATHGLLGALVQDAASIEGSTITGAFIKEAGDGGAAAAGGIRAGDVVTQFNGIPITDATDLTAQVRAAAAGSEATVTYVRDGKTLTAKVTLGELTQ